MSYQRRDDRLIHKTIKQRLRKTKSVLVVDTAPQSKPLAEEKPKPAHRNR